MSNTRSIAQKSACAILLMLAGSIFGSANAEDRIRIGDRQSYAKGPYVAYASPWATTIPPNDELLPGSDYEDTIAISPDTFPADTTITWRWPDRYPVKAGVWGYFGLSYGSYEGGTPETPVDPIQVERLSSWVERIDFELSGDPEGHNILNEFYLTSKPGDEASKLFEIALFLHTTARDVNFVTSAQRVGMFADSHSRVWSVSTGKNPHGVRYLAFMPVDRNDVVGEIDLKAMLSFLIARRVITGSEWVGGIGLGVEPHRGTGEMKIRHWSAAFQ